jgi:tRNA-dihydrouridine synthase
MEGVTNAAVREVLASYGPVGLVCTEFVRISGGQISAAYLRRQVEKLPSVPLSVQVMGNDPELMAEAGAVVAVVPRAARRARASARPCSNSRHCSRAC